VVVILFFCIYGRFRHGGDLHHSASHSFCILSVGVLGVFCHDNGFYQYNLYENKIDFDGASIRLERAVKQGWALPSR